MLGSDIASPFSASPSMRHVPRFTGISSRSVCGACEGLPSVRPALRAPSAKALFCRFLIGLPPSFRVGYKPFVTSVATETVALWPCSRRLTVVGRTQVPTWMRLFVDFPFMSYAFGVNLSALPHPRSRGFPLPFTLRGFRSSVWSTESEG